jgi:hypothetical protein
MVTARLGSDRGGDAGLAGVELVHLAVGADLAAAARQQRLNVAERDVSDGAQGNQGSNRRQGHSAATATGSRHSIRSYPQSVA